MKIHCIGIGGIGVSALAQYYLSRGHQVSGSDLVASEITDSLKEKGVEIMIGNSAEHIKKGIEMVVFSPAVAKDNPEYVKAKELGLVLKSYPQALGDLTKEYKTIAVAGAHGKSTTTAMIGLLLEKAGIDPTVIVGTLLKEYGNSNFRAGQSQYLVIEACEYDGSFLEYKPQITVVTNLDKEHLDYFGDFKTVVKTFKDFISHLPKEGFLVANKDDDHLVGISKGDFTTKFYSLLDKDVEKMRGILKIPGYHNVSNALAALTVARILGVPDEVSFASLSEYKGSWRRFEIFEKELKNPKTLKPISYTLISDYGHHPNEISVTFKATREKYHDKKIWCIYQPHQYQRTYYLFDDFVKVFREADIDNIIIVDIYDVAGREEQTITSNVSSKTLVQNIKKQSVQYLSVAEAENYVKEHIQEGDVLMIMGAGDIYKLVEKF